MLLILQMLLLLSPQQKELIAMVRQGDMFAADELVQSVCKLPEDERGKAIAISLRKLRGGKTRAHQLATDGLEGCKPAAAEPKKKPDSDDKAADKTKKEAEKKPEKKAEKKAEKKPEKKVAPVVSETAGGRRTPVVSAPDDVSTASPAKPTKTTKPTKATETAKKKPELADDDGLPEGDDDRSKVRTTGKSRREQRRRERRKKAEDRKAKLIEPEIAEIAPRSEETRVAAASTAEPEGAAAGPAQVTTERSIGDIDSRATMQEAMTFYSIGGGFVAVAVVSYVGALALLGNGAFQHLQLEPVTDPSLTTADGRTAQQVYDERVMGIWSAAGLLAGLAGVSATAEIIAGFVLMNEGSERIEAF